MAQWVKAWAVKAWVRPRNPGGGKKTDSWQLSSDVHTHSVAQGIHMHPHSK